VTYSFEELGLVDAPPESMFDNLTKLATSLFKIPVSLVTIIDFDKNRQFFKSQLGLAEPLAGQRQTPLSHSFCQYVVNDNATLVIENAALHPKVKDNLAVRDLGVATYLGSPIYNLKNEPIGAFCVLDVKPRRWTLEEIEQLERLSNCITDAIKLKAAYLDSEALRKEQADFSYAISHELKSPANTLHLILNEIALEGDGISDDAHQLVKEGLGTVTRMQDQVESVLHYSQTTQKGGAIEAISLNVLFKEILLDLKADISASDSSINCEELPVIMGNRMQIRALFQNLVSNALKFIAPERKSLVSISSTFNESSAQHCIMVKDNGIGIAVENQASIFRLFNRLHLHTEYAGSGIGLALCHRVMRNHHGSIQVASNGQDGSTFTVVFPDLR